MMIVGLMIERYCFSAASKEGSPQSLRPSSDGCGETLPTGRRFPFCGQILETRMELPKLRYRLTIFYEKICSYIVFMCIDVPVLGEGQHP